VGEGDVEQDELFREPRGGAGEESDEEGHPEDWVRIHAGTPGSDRGLMGGLEGSVGYLTRISFMMRPDTFQSWTYKLPSPSQDEPCVPLKIPSIHCSCGTL